MTVGNVFAEFQTCLFSRFARSFYLSVLRSRKFVKDSKLKTRGSRYPKYFQEELVLIFQIIAIG